MSGAVKVPEAQVAGVVLDPRFPVLSVAVYGDSAPVTPDSLGEVPAPATATTRVIAWESGKVRIAIEGADQRPLYLVLGENWYKDWRATVDGAAVPVLRAQHTLLSVLVPPGAREVAFEFVSPEYGRGRMITLLALGVLLVAPRLRPGPAANG
jgi:hypothetical protein